VGEVPAQPQAGTPGDLPKARGNLRAGGRVRFRPGADPGQEPPGCGSRPDASHPSTQIDAYWVEIEKLFPKHPDHDLFGSLIKTGTGTVQIGRGTAGGATTYAGTTMVKAGTLVIGGTLIVSGALSGSTVVSVSNRRHPEAVCQQRSG